MTDELYTKVKAITEEYLGPAAERFVSRQISFHLGKIPEELTSNDLPKFIEWTTLTFNMLTDDRQLVDEYVRRISELAHE